VKHILEHKKTFSEFHRFSIEIQDFYFIKNIQTKKQNSVRIFSLIN